MCPVRNRRLIASQSLIGWAVVPEDDMESYGAGALNGLNGGKNGNHVFVIRWSSPYSSRENYMGILAYSDLENFVNASNLDTQVDGIGFNGGYVSH
jgi:hypothetical protein